MSYQFGPRDPSSELVEIIRQVRRRWRMKLALRGALGVVAVGLLVLVLSALGLESWRFTPGAIITFRVILGVALVGLVGYLLVRPLMRSASDEQVALYLEEHEPSLQAGIISAVEAGHGGADSPYSATLVRKLVESAVDKCKEIESGRRVERVPVRRYGLTLAALAVGAIALFGLGPAYLRHALSALFVVSRDVLAAAPYRIEVTPGNATVPRGADQTITAHLSGFDAEQASLLVRKTPDAAYERVTLLRGDDGKYEGMLFDLAAPISYFVEANGVRSEVFTLKVVELPYVQRLELEYHFPAYTGLPPQKIEDGGDIAVLKGTEIRVRALPTMQSPGGQIVLVGHGAQRARAGGRRRIPHAADGGVQGRQGRVLPDRARRAVRRTRDRLAAVHDRRAGRSAAHGLHQQARARHLRLSDRGSVRRSARGRRFRRARSGSRATPSTADRKRRSACSTARSGCRRSRPATPSISRSWTSRRATSSRTTRRRPTTTACRARSRR